MQPTFLFTYTFRQFRHARSTLTLDCTATDQAAALESAKRYIRGLNRACGVPVLALPPLAQIRRGGAPA